MRFLILIFLVVAGIGSPTGALAQSPTEEAPIDYTAEEEAGTLPLPEGEARGPDEPQAGVEVVAPSPSPGRGASVEELVVTAQKRAEDIQDVPISISALPNQFIEDSGLTNVLDMSQYVPNVQINALTDSRSTAIRILSLIHI